MNTNMYEFIIAAPGGAITDAEKDLNFTSNRDCLKEKLSGLVDTDNSGNVTITHNLGYIPAFTVFAADYSDQSTWYSYDSADTYATTTKLEITGAMGGVKAKIYYAIFSTAL